MKKLSFIIAGEYGVIKILLERGADPKAKTVGFPGEPSSTPAEYARDNGYVEIALKLEGKNPATYRTTLHYFARKGDIQIRQGGKGID